MYKRIQLNLRFTFDIIIQMEIRKLEKSILCGVVNALYPPWIEIIKNGQEKTWLSEELPIRCEFIHFHGTPINKKFMYFDIFRSRMRFKNKFIDYGMRLFEYLFFAPFLLYVPRNSPSKYLETRIKEINIDEPDFYATVRWKLIGIMDYFINETNHDFLFLTTSSSYIVPTKLLSIIDELPEGDVYAGGYPYETAEFVSGSNRILSRSLVVKVLKYRRKWDPTLLEDVALGKLIRGLGVFPIFYPLKNISSLNELRKIGGSEILNNYHFRLKSQRIAGSDLIRDDVEIMLELHNIVRKLKY